MRFIRNFFWRGRREREPQYPPKEDYDLEWHTMPKSKPLTENERRTHRKKWIEDIKSTLRECPKYMELMSNIDLHDHPNEVHTATINFRHGNSLYSVLIGSDRRNDVAIVTQFDTLTQHEHSFALNGANNSLGYTRRLESREIAYSINTKFAEYQMYHILNSLRDHPLT